LPFMLSNSNFFKMQSSSSKYLWGESMLRHKSRRDARRRGAKGNETAAF
jgi:hypothetical protein